MHDILFLFISPGKPPLPFSAYSKRLILKIQISPISPSREGLDHNPSFPDPTLAKSYSTNLYNYCLSTHSFSLLSSIFHNMALYYSFQCNNYLQKVFWRQRHCSEVVKGSQNAHIQGSSTYYLLDFRLTGQPLCLGFLLSTKRASSLTHLKESSNKSTLAKHMEQGLECRKLQQTLAVTFITTPNHIPGLRKYTNK